MLGRLMDLKGRIILDMGCGYGGYALDAAKSGAHYVVALDIDYNKIKSQKSRQDILTYVLADGESLPLRDSSLDVVFLMDVLEHVQYESPILWEARRVLRCSGLLFISAPNRFYPFETHGMHLSKIKFDVPILFLSYMPKWLRRRVVYARVYTVKVLFFLLRDAKFDMVMVEYHMPTLDALRGFEKIKTSMRKLFRLIERIPGLRSTGTSINIVARKRK